MLLTVSAITTPLPPGIREMPIGFLKRELGSGPSRKAGLKHPEFSDPTWICDDHPDVSTGAPGVCARDLAHLHAFFVVARNNHISAYRGSCRDGPRQARP